MAMADGVLIAVEVAYATPERQKIVTLQLAERSSAREAVLASELDADFNELDLNRCPIGVFGSTVVDDYTLRAGDRVEIYRPLLNEPREARRAAAVRGDTLGARKQG
jgi:putative ubiquitin-RnfH superfamily antitoxin RatB of RatAB toxin-antitoxin module